MRCPGFSPFATSRCSLEDTLQAHADTGGVHRNGALAWRVTAADNQRWRRRILADHDVMLQRIEDTIGRRRGPWLWHSILDGTPLCWCRMSRTMRRQRRRAVHDMRRTRNSRSS